MHTSSERPRTDIWETHSAEVERLIEAVEQDGHAYSLAMGELLRSLHSISQTLSGKRASDNWPIDIVRRVNQSSFSPNRRMEPGRGGRTVQVTPGGNSGNCPRVRLHFASLDNSSLAFGRLTGCCGYLPDTHTWPARSCSPSARKVMPAAARASRKTSTVAR